VAVFVVLRLSLKRPGPRHQGPPPATKSPRPSLLPPKKVVLISLPAFATALLVGARSAWPTLVTLLVVAAGAWIVWIVLFSGRVRTATHEFRARLTHVLFTMFFVVYALGIALWLSVGLLAAVTGH